MSRWLSDATPPESKTQIQFDPSRGRRIQTRFGGTSLRPCEGRAEQLEILKNGFQAIDLITPSISHREIILVSHQWASIVQASGKVDIRSAMPS